MFAAAASSFGVLTALTLAAMDPVAPTLRTHELSAATRSDTLPEYVSEAISLYALEPDRKRVAELLDRWSSEDGGPDGPEDFIAVATLWGRARQPALALAALEGVPRDSEFTSLVSLIRARAFFASAPDAHGAVPERTPALRSAISSFWDACEHMNDRVKRELWLDLRGLMTPDEAEAWSDLTAGPAACDYVRRLFDERAWRMAISTNQRLALHYDRLYQARLRYVISKPRWTDDMLDLEGRPDSLEVDDRGLLYIRMGPPGGAFNCSGPISFSETWAYYRPDGPRIYFLAPVSRSKFGQVEDYRAQESLGAFWGALLNLGYGSSGDLNYLLQERITFGGGDPCSAFFSGFGAPTTLAGISGDRQRGLRSARGNSVRRWEQLRAEEYGRYALQELPDVPALRPDVSVAHESLRFRNPSRDETTVWMIAAARSGDLVGIDAGAGTRYATRTQIGLMSEGRLALSGDEVSVTSAEPLEGDDGVVARIPIELAAGAYPYTIAVHDLNRVDTPTGNWIQDTLVVPVTRSAFPEISDLAVAADSGGDWTRDGRTFLAVTPTHVVGPDGMLHLYFEVYAFRAGGEYEVEVRVVAEKLRDEVYEIPEDRVVFTLRYDDAMPADRIGRQYLRLDLSGAPPGSYVVAARATGKVTGTPSLPAVATITVPWGAD